MSWIMTFYTTDRGEKPVLEFIKAQQLPARTKISHLMDLLKKHGNMLGVPHSKRLQSELYELRIRGKEELRILYAFKGEVVILLHAFKKQTQKTPQKEMGTALKRMREFDLI